MPTSAHRPLKPIVERERFYAEVRRYGDDWLATKLHAALLAPTSVGSRAPWQPRLRLRRPLPPPAIVASSGIASGRSTTRTGSCWSQPPGSRFIPPT